MHVFCTYFDSNYVDRGICLWRSLKNVCPCAKLYVCCLDEEAFDVLTTLAYPDLTPIRIEDIEKLFPALAAAKSTRSTVEYYFTQTPSLIRYVFENWPSLEEVTYVDSDLLFFSDPEPLFEEMRSKNGAVAIIAHRFTPQLEHLKIHGTYNVGWLTFKRSAAAWSCLLDWQQDCIDWCYDHVDGDRFADQKYLDFWARKYEGIIVLDHPGANVALWNLAPESISENGKQLRIFGQPLIFYHFHGLSQIKPHLFYTSARMYEIRLNFLFRKKIYGAYISMLLRIQKELRNENIRPLLRYKHTPDDIAAAKRHPTDGNFLMSVASFTFSPPAMYWRWTEWLRR